MARRCVSVIVSFLLLWSSSACTHLKVQTMESSASSVDSSSVGLECGGVIEPLEDDTDLEQAGVTFAAFRTSADVRNSDGFEGDVLTQLWLLRNGARELVHRAQDSSWSRIDLIPGEYELEVVEIYEGQRAYPPNQDNVIGFSLLPGTTMQVNLIANKVPWGAVAIVSVVAVLVVGLIVYAIVADDMPELGKLRLPSRVRTSRVHIRIPQQVRLPRIRWHGMFSYHGPMDFPLDIFLEGLHTPVRWTPLEYPETLPPAPNLTEIQLPGVYARSGAITLVFDRPMEPYWMGPDTIQLIRDDGQPVPGGVYYDASRNATVFRPLRPLSCARYKLVVLGELILDLDGVSLPGNYEHVFGICPAASPN